jgi:sugar/nucleoside kinase (ribokinase family)
LTLGADGVLIFDKGTMTHFKAGSIGQSEIKSVVGAGDCFLAGYVYGLQHGHSEDKCV